MPKTASLDHVNRAIVVRLIVEAKERGSAILGVFRDREVRRAVADRILEMGGCPCKADRHEANDRKNCRCTGTRPS